MRTAVRVVVVVAAAVSLAATGCESKNKGKLEGTKWKGSIPSAPGASMTMEFYADGRLVMGVHAANVNKIISGKWSLSFGDYVDMTDLSEPLSGRTSHKEKIVVTGNTLVMTDSDGQSVTFTRVGAEAAAANSGWNK
jgi:hypothetical protein